MWCSYVPDWKVACVSVCARLHGVRLYCADHWCLLSLKERETTDPFVSVLPRKKRAQKEFKHKNQKRSIFSPFGILSAINQKHPCIPPCFWDEDEEWMNKWMKKWLDNEGVLVCDETQSMCKSTWIQGWNLYWLTDLLQEQRECHTARVTNVGYIYTAKS